MMERWKRRMRDRVSCKKQTMNRFHCLKKSLFSFSSKINIFKLFLKLKNNHMMGRHGSDFVLCPIEKKVLNSTDLRFSRRPFKVIDNISEEF